MKNIKTTNLRKYYGTGDNIIKALDGIDLEIDHGDFVAVVGASGSGKSTLLHMLGGLDNATEGSVLVQDKGLFDLDEEELAVFRRRNVGFVFQNYNLIPILNVYENIILPIQLDGRDIDEEYVNSIIETLGLDEKKYSLPNNLSGGQQQRVAIARAVVANPKLILADEPTGNLDSANGEEVMKLLSELNKEGTTIIMVTHSPSDAEYAHRIVQLFDGHIVTENIRKIL
ncbi:MAG: ABC transporter ATP-binding protein [Clostridiales bacterium]|nr:ABC transporter ATP-binding protein [Clostridiales bacterium]